MSSKRLLLILLFIHLSACQMLNMKPSELEIANNEAAKNDVASTELKNKDQSKSVSKSESYTNEQIQKFIDEQIIRVRVGIMDSKDKFLNCYSESKESSEGFVVYYFMLTEDGSVSQLKQTQSNFNNSKLLGCVKDEFKLLKFAPNDRKKSIYTDAIPIMVPLEFQNVGGKLTLISN